MFGIGAVFRFHVEAMVTSRGPAVVVVWVIMAVIVVGVGLPCSWAHWPANRSKTKGQLIGGTGRAILPGFPC
jgi:hypothetical protein